MTASDPRRPRYVAALLVAFLASGGATAPSLAAQELADSATSIKADLLADLDAGVRLRLHAEGRDDPLEGTLVGLNGSTASINVRERVEPVSLDEVDAIWVWDGKAGKGALIGAAVVGLGGALVLGMFAQGLCDKADCGGAWVEGAAPGAGLGLLVGGAAGALIGFAASDWERLFP